MVAENEAIKSAIHWISTQRELYRRTYAGHPSEDGGWTVPMEEYELEMADYFAEVLQIDENSIETIMDIGSLNGKWTGFLSKYCNKIICVDLFDDCFENIKERYPKTNLDFYVGSGMDLKGIDSESVDLLFSIDSISRASRTILNSYIREFSRVLKKGAKATIHAGMAEPMPVGEFDAYMLAECEKSALKVIDVKKLERGGQIYYCQKVRP
tara:strand:- start:561 stop:1193 length:633 start_codon:yes stop_codon:yes gene_type:complete